MRSGSVCNAISHPCPNVADRQFTRLRTIFDAIFYVLHTGCPWRYLPASFPPWQTVFYHFRRLRRVWDLDALVASVASPSTRTTRKASSPKCSQHGFAIRVKTVEESSGICGYDAHKHIKGRKRHLLVDTLGIPISIYVTPADTHDTKGARCLLAGLKFFVPRLCKDLGRCGKRAGRR